MASSARDRPDRRTLASRFLAARLDRESYLGLRLSVGVLVVALAVWLFGGLLEEVLDDEALVRADIATEAWLHVHATPGGLRVFDAITQIGGAVVVVVAVVGAVVLWRRADRLLFWTWLAANGLGQLLLAVLKRSIHRHRPEYAAAYLHGHSYSFPSGHAMGSTICYGMLAAVIVIVARPERPQRALIYAASGLLVAAIGFSRLYLGVHYPSDVIGGFAAGTAWLATCLTAYDVTRRRAVARAMSDDSPRHAPSRPAAP